MDAATQSLVRSLQEFNRKERYWLARYAVGQPFLTLSKRFRQNLGAAISTSERQVQIPECAWWAIDYHIDWLVGALRLEAAPDEVGPFLNGGEITGTQQDIDLLVAFNRTIVLVEAKGATAWNNEQLRSKRERLNLVHGLAEQSAVSMYLVLASPGKPQKLDHADWPDFGKLPDGAPYHITLPMEPPSPLGFRLVTRGSKGSKSWGYAWVQRPRS